jgi:hypothetical protein
MRCSSLNVLPRDLVERSYLHPVMGVILAGLAAACFAVGTDNLLATLVVGGGFLLTTLFVPVSRRTIGASFTCTDCGYAWAEPAGAHTQRLRVIR